MKVYLIRHAESENNRLLSKLMTLDFSAAKSSFFDQRSSDPGLSKRGEAQARNLSEHLFDILKSKLKRCKVCIYTSPMLRALMTTEIIAEKFGPTNVSVSDMIHEVGGIYGPAFEPVDSRTVEELRSAFSSFNFSKLSNTTGMWYRNGFEARGTAIRRAGLFVNWLRDASLQQEMGNNGILMVISHGEFLDLLLQELLLINPEVSKDAENKYYIDSSKDDIQRPHIFRLENCSHSLIDIQDTQLKVHYTNRCAPGN